MSLRWGLINCRSPKQKLNTKSSIVAEVIGLSDYVPFIISIRLFVKAQDYPIKSNVLYLDNQSTLLLERNGWDSYTENSCHIHIRYFLVKGKQDKGKFSINYFLTWKMLADCFMKPLQLRLFDVFG